MKKSVILLSFLLFFVSISFAQVQQTRRTVLFSAADSQQVVLQPGMAFEQDVLLPATEVPQKRTLRVVGGGLMPGPFAPRGEEFFRQQESLIEDNLDSVNIHKDKYALYFKGDNDAFERHAYFRIPAERVRKGFAMSYKRNRLKVAPGGDFGVELQLYYHKEGRSVYDVYQAPDSVIFVSVPEGSGRYKILQCPLSLPQEVATVLVRVGGTLFSGECWLEAPSCCAPFGSSLDIAATSASPNTGIGPEYWVGVNLATRSWPKWKLEFGGRTLFHGVVFDRSSNVADFYIPLPQDLVGQGTLRLTLEKEPHRKAYAYAIESVQLLEESARAFEIAVVPKWVRVGDTTAFLIETHQPDLTLEFQTQRNSISLLDKTLYAEYPGLYAVSFVAVKPDSRVVVQCVDGTRTVDAEIAQLLIKDQDRVLLSSGDEVYIDKVPAQYTPFFKWYFRERVGNAYQFRPSYQWSGVRITSEQLMTPYLQLLQKMHVPYAWQVEGRTLAATSINLPISALKSTQFLGKQAHENDGGYYYWQHFKYKGLYSDMAARARPFGGIFAKHAPIYTPYGTFIHYDPYGVSDMADGAARFVANLSYSRGESTRHTGPSTMFRYLYQAGYDWLGAEQMYGPEEVILSSLRGASRAYGKKTYGSLHAMQWGSGPFTDPKHALRLYLSLAVAYMHGSSHMNTEEALWTDEYAHDRFTPSGAQHLYAQHQLLDYLQTHSRKGDFHAHTAVIQGRNDAWKCFGRTSIWSQEGEKWAFNQAMESFDLLQVYYPQSKLTYCSKEGLFTKTPYGPVDLLPIEAPLEVLKTYGVLVFLGWNSFENVDFIKILKYVQQGGTVLLTAAHLNSQLQPHLPVRFPQDDTVVKMLLGEDYRLYQDRTERHIGQGRVIYYPSPEYPANVSLRDAYQEDMHALAAQQVAQEYQNGWVHASEHIDFAVWDAPDFRTLYLLNIDWDSNGGSGNDNGIAPLSHTAVLQLGSNTFSIEVPPYTLATVRCRHGVAAWLQANTSDILEIRQESGQCRIVYQTTGPDQLHVFRASTGRVESTTCTGAGIHEWLVP